MLETQPLRGPGVARLPRQASLLAPELVGRSAAIRHVQELVRRAAAAVEGGVLIIAEHGIDVESVARELHWRGREGAPFVAIHCGVTGLDRLLFGEPTGHTPPDLEAISSNGRLAAARDGTLFLYEVADLPAGVQARLARVARDGEAYVDGVAVTFPLRLIASASSTIDADVQAHRFRTDLYRRLSAWRIDWPALRDRSDDVPAMANRLVDELCAARGLPSRTFTRSALVLLSAMSWPGNIAELREVLARVVSGTADAAIHVEHVLPALRLDRVAAPRAPAGSLREARFRFERDYIIAVLRHHGWRMADAAQVLGIQRSNLYRKARQLGIPLAAVSE